MGTPIKAFTVGVLAALSLAFAAQAQAQAPSSLDRILKDKKIRVTAEVTAPPFGMLDANGQPDGSEIATARQLAKDLGVEVEFIQVDGPQRIPTLLSGRADIAISSLSMTIDRAKVVMFASPHGALSIVIAGPAGVNIKDADGISAASGSGITRATLEEATVPKIAPPDARIVLFDDIAATIQALLSGQVDAAGFSAFTAKSVADRNPDKKIENKFTVTTAFYAAAVRPGDHDLLQFVNTWVALRTARRHARADLREVHRREARASAAALIRKAGAAPGRGSLREWPVVGTNRHNHEYVFQFGVVADHFDALVAGAAATLRLSRDRHGLRPRARDRLRVSARRRRRSRCAGSSPPMSR